jgi:hypothetical protein
MRRAPAGDEPLSRMRLRGGRELAVINVSNAGVLSEGPVRLLPGSHVEVHVVRRDGRVLVRSRVVRCHVERLLQDAVVYRAGLAFERFIDTCPPEYACVGPASRDDGPMSPAPIASTSEPHQG